MQDPSPLVVLNAANCSDTTHKLEPDSGKSPAWRVSVIIPAYNEESVLAACLQSILNQKCGERAVICEIIVADNCSTDSTCAVARSFGARTVSVSPGYAGRARNAGARHATGNVLAFVDADCVVPPNWLECCLEHFADGQVVASALPHASPGSQATWVQRAWFQLMHPTAEVATVKWLPAFNFVVRRESFLRVNGFDETLRTCEDSDLSFRLARLGSMVLDGRAGALHLGESSNLWQFARREMWRSAGNIASAARRGTLRDELASIALPLVILLLLLVGLSLIGFGIAFSAAAVVVGAILAGLVLLAPIAVAMRKRLYPWRQPILFAQCWLLLSTYLLARALGMLIPAPRPQRKSSTEAIPQSTSSCAANNENAPPGTAPR